MPKITPAQLAALAQYSACDIADALLQLNVRGAGYLPGFSPVPAPIGGPTSNSTTTISSRIVAPVATVLFTARSTQSFPQTGSSLSTLIRDSLFVQPTPNIPDGVAWSDLVVGAERSSSSSSSVVATADDAAVIVPPDPSTLTLASPIPDEQPLPATATSPPIQGARIVLLSQPPGQACAVLGGIHAARLARSGGRCVAVLVDGRVRDLAELQRESSAGNHHHDGSSSSSICNSAMPIWCTGGSSVVGAKAETMAWSVNVPLQVGPSEVNPDDIVMIDPTDRGVVCIPASKVAQVLSILPKLIAADDLVLGNVRQGMSVTQAFDLFRK